MPTPCTVSGFQLTFPYTTWPQPPTIGEAAITDEHCWAMARASSAVRVTVPLTSLMDAAAAVALRKNDNHVGAERFELALHKLAGALPDGNHGGHCRNADHHAKNREAGAHLVFYAGHVLRFSW